MSEITQKFKATIITLMIISGAINTIGSQLSTQPISFKIRRWSSKGNSTNTSSTPTCRYPPLHSGRHHVLRIVARPHHVLHHEEPRRRRIQNAHARSQVQGKRNLIQQIPARHSRSQRPHHLHPPVRGPQLRRRLCLPDDERRSHRHHFPLLHLLPQNEGPTQPSRRQRPRPHWSAHRRRLFPSLCRQQRRRRR